jgi:hypothetical protein
LAPVLNYVSFLFIEEDGDGEGDGDGNGEVDVEMGRWRKLNESRYRDKEMYRRMKDG